MKCLAIAALALFVSGTATAGDAPTTEMKGSATLKTETKTEGEKTGAQRTEAEKPDAKKAETPITKDRAMMLIDRMIASANVDKSNPGWRTSLPQPSATSFDTTHRYYAVMSTNKGTIRIHFFPEVAPLHVTNFIYLTRLGFYDGLSFHRVIPGFMAQGGCPLGNGTGNPGYVFRSEISPKVKHDKPGLLSMANAGKGTDGSQFFLTFAPAPWLDGKHTIFGEVVEGMDVLKKLEAAGTPAGRTKEPLKMESVTIEVK